MLVIKVLGCFGSYREEFLVCYILILVNDVCGLFIFLGVGWVMFVVLVFICIYYNMIIVYILYYFFVLFVVSLLWVECGEWVIEGGKSCFF